MCLNPSRVRNDQLHGKDHDQHQPDPERRQRETEDAACHDRPPEEPVRPHPGVKPERHADHDRQQNGRHRQLHRGRHPFRNEFQGRFVEDETTAQVAVQSADQEGQVLPPQRLVQAEIGDDPSALGLVGLGGDQDVHRIADHVYADEDDDGHRQHNERGLYQAPDQPDQHRTTIAVSVCVRLGCPA